MTITNGYTTLAAQKAAMIPNGATNTADDGVIESMITQASRIFDGETLRTFYARTETHYYDCPADGRTLDILDDDLLTVTTLTNGDGSVITSTTYALRPRNTTAKNQIVLNLLGTTLFTISTTTGTEDAISVLGTWGYSSTTPADVEAAVIDIVTNAYHRRFGVNTEGAATVTGSGVVITPRDIPDSAWRTIARYRRRL